MTDDDNMPHLTDGSDGEDEPRGAGWQPWWAGQRPAAAAAPGGGGAAAAAGWEEGEEPAGETSWGLGAEQRAEAGGPEDVDAALGWGSEAAEEAGSTASEEQQDAAGRAPA